MPCCGVASGWFPGLFAVMLVGMVIGVVLLVVLIWALVRWLNHLASTSRNQPNQPHAQASAQSAEDILRERYARGEIDAATFEEMLARLHGTGQPTTHA